MPGPGTELNTLPLSMAHTERALGDATRWISARGRNALRRSTPILAAGSIVFVATMAAFLVIPFQMNRVARAIAPRPEERPDTLAILAGIVRAEAALVGARTTLDAVRARAIEAATAPLPADTLSTQARLRRDSLAGVAAALAPLIERAETAPLPASFRALADHPAVSGDRRVRALVDSLAEVERQREVFGAAGGVDPIYVALTSRAAALGRAILQVAEERVDSLRAEIETIRPPPAALTVARPVVDTMAAFERHANAARALDSARAALEQARERHDELDARAEQASRLAIVGTPPAAVLVAAIVLALVAGYTLALVIELRHPRVADGREVERLTGVRVLGVVRPHEPPPERARRRADRLAPPLILTTDETYRRLYLYLAASSSASPLITFTGEDPAITGVVGANVAAMAAFEARSTLLVDADLDHCTLAAVMRVPVAPGLAEILRGQVDWAEAVVPTTVGRDRTIFVVPSGGGDPPPLTDELRRRLRDDLERMARRYDVVAVVTSHPASAHVGLDLLPVPDVVYCAEVGSTSLARLMQAVREMQEAGARVRGIVLWDLDVPELPSRGDVTWGAAAGGAAGGVVPSSSASRAG